MQTGDDLINTQYGLHYGLLAVSVSREGIKVVVQWRGYLLRWIRVGWVLTNGKRQFMGVLSILKFTCAFVQANQSFLITF